MITMNNCNICFPHRETGCCAEGRRGIEAIVMMPQWCEERPLWVCQKIRQQHYDNMMSIAKRSSL